MLNKDGVRELAYVVKVDEIRPIEGKDRVECAVVGGWTCMVPKDQFKAGDLGIYFEIDSKVDTSKPYFAFLEKRHGKIKTQKFRAGEGHFYSQGLLMAASDFGWEIHVAPYGVTILSSAGELKEGDFLTKELGVVYADADDNKRKGKSADKYQKMAQRMGEKFSKQPYRWLMKRMWGKKLLFLFFGKKRDNKTWPTWVVKTDEERVQNLAHMLPEYSQEEWVATEKIDGTSTTFTMKGFGRKREFYVCSRNVVFDKPDKKCFYETNVYTEMAEKYNMEYVLGQILDMYSAVCNFVTIQGETYGEGIQKRDYSLKGHDLAVFNVILGYDDGHTERLNPYEMKELMDEFLIPSVPILGKVNVTDNCDEILATAGGASRVDGLPREGIVFRTLDGAKSFKAVDNEFLVKYHG